MRGKNEEPGYRRKFWNWVRLKWNLIVSMKIFKIIVGNASYLSWKFKYYKSIWPMNKGEWRFLGAMFLEFITICRFLIPHMYLNDIIRHIILKHTIKTFTLENHDFFLFFHLLIICGVFQCHVLFVCLNVDVKIVFTLFIWIFCQDIQYTVIYYVIYLVLL